MNPKENDNEIIELTDEELDEIFADDDFDNGEEDAEIRSFYFSNPDPYAKVKPRPDDAPKRVFSFDEKGNIVVKNPSAFWLPDVKSSVYRARNHCGCIRSGWCRLRSESESLTVFSSAFTRTMLPVGWTMNASP